MHSGNGQQEQHDEEQQSHVTANGCAAVPSVLARRSSSSSVNSVRIETSLLSFPTTRGDVATAVCRLGVNFGPSTRRDTDGRAALSESGPTLRAEQRRGPAVASPGVRRVAFDADG